EVWCRYDATRFEEATIRRLLAWFGVVATGVLDAPRTQLDELPLAADADVRASLSDFNDVGRAYPDGSTVTERFFAGAAEYPEAVALETGATSLSYRDLAARARRLATVLAEEGVGRGDRVVLLMDPSASLIEAMLAVMTLGASYVPVDPAYPQTRQDEIIKQVAARVVLSSSPASRADG